MSRLGCWFMFVGIVVHFVVWIVGFTWVMLHLFNV